MYLIEPYGVIGNRAIHAISAENVAHFLFRCATL
jgi:hypothetical protein